MSVPTTTPIGDRPLSLAKHLRAAVDKLLDEAGTSYAWFNPGQCNCGLLARAIRPELTADCARTDCRTLSATISSRIGIIGRLHCRVGWTAVAQQYCSLTDLPTSVVLETLFAAGMLPEDIESVEYCTHPELGGGGINWDDRKYAAAYLLSWSRAIEAWHAAHPAAQLAPTDESVTIATSVPEATAIVSI